MDIKYNYKLITDLSDFVKFKGKSIKMLNRLLLFKIAVLKVQIFIDGYDGYKCGIFYLATPHPFLFHFVLFAMEEFTTLTKTLKSLLRISNQSTAVEHQCIYRLKSKL